MDGSVGGCDGWMSRLQLGQLGEERNPILVRIQQKGSQSAAALHSATAVAPEQGKSESWRGQFRFPLRGVGSDGGNLARPKNGMEEGEGGRT